MTPPISNHAGIQTLSRRHQLAKCSGHDVNATAEPTDELTGSYQAARDDKLGFTVTRVARQSSVGDRTRFWEPLRDKLRGVHERFIKLRQDAGAPPGISAIRVLDILLWMAFPKNPRFH